MAAASQEIEVEPQKQGILASGVSVLRATWKYKHFVPTVLTTIVSHHVQGPPHEAWPLETSLFTAVVRHAGRSRAKPDPLNPRDPVKAIQAFRKSTAFEHIMPPPTNGFAADVAVPVLKRGLEGVLKELDSLEDGSRTVEAEWVVHNDVHALGVNASEKVVLYLHGGAYMLLNRASHRPLTILVSKAANCRVLSVDYRLAPETPFPGALHDAVASYFYLTQELHIPASNIIVSGDSAGGGLSMALLLYLRDHQLPSLGGAILLSPWVDPTASLGSWDSNAHLDYLTGDDDKTMDPMRLYLGENYDKYLTHPYVCSAIADLSRLPPLLIQCGGAEVLRDEDSLLAQRASAAGVEVTHEIFDGAIHVAQAFIKTEVSRAALLAMADWVARQPIASKADFTSIDPIIDAEFSARQAKPSTRAKPASPPSPLPSPIFAYTAVVEPAPRIHLRDEAHPALRAAVEEVGKVPAKAITSHFMASRVPTVGLLSRVWGSLHL